MPTSSGLAPRCRMSICAERAASKRSLDASAAGSRVRGLASGSSGAAGIRTIGLRRIGRHARPFERSHTGQSRLPDARGWTRGSRQPEGDGDRRPLASSRPIRLVAGSCERPDGQPTGVVIDGAQALVTSAIPRIGRQQLEDQIQLADRELRRVGITTVHDAGADGDTVDAYKRLIDAATIKTRLYVMLRGSLRRADAVLRARPARRFRQSSTGRQGRQDLRRRCPRIARRSAARAVLG